MTSLRAQLSALAQSNPDSTRLDSVARRDSYIYSPTQAGRLSSDELHQIGLDGLHQLINSDQEFQQFRHPLFGEAAKRTDRTLLDSDEATALKQIIDKFLFRLAPHILTKPSAYAIEWLVRRFRIHEFDVPTLVSIFLPYYATPQFMAILNILRLEQHPYLAFLKPVKKTRTGLPQKHLIESLISHPELLRYVAQILPTFLQFNPTSIHQAAVGFHFATFLGLFETLAAQSTLRDSFPQPVLAAILPSILQGLKTSILDVKLTTYILLTKLALSSVLEISILTNLARALVDSYEEYPVDKSNVQTESGWYEHDEALVKALIILFQCNRSGTDPHLSIKSCQTLASIPNSSKLFMHLCETVEISSFWSAFIQGLANGALKNEPHSAETLYSFSHMFISSSHIIETIAEIILLTLARMETPSPSLLRPLGIISQKHHEMLEKVAQNLITKGDADIRQPIENLLRVASGGVALIPTEGPSDILELSSSSAILRLSALRRILEQINSSAPSPSSFDIVTPAIKAALTDPDPTVAELLFAYPDAIKKIMSIDDILSAAHVVLDSTKVSRATCSSWISFLVGPFLASYPSKASDIAEDLLLDRIFWTKSNAKATAVIWSSGLSRALESWQGTILEGVHLGVASSDDPSDRISANKSLFDIVTNGVIKLGDSAVTKLLRKLKTKPASPLARLIPLMILRQAVPRLSQTMLCQLLNAVIDHVLQRADRDGFERWINLSMEETAEKTEKIGDSFYSKSGSEKVFNHIAADTVLKALSRLRMPADLEYCWFEASNASLNHPDSQLASNVLHLHFKLYRLGHAGGKNAKADNFANRVLVSLLRGSLGKENLVFLARLWTSSSCDVSLRTTALLDAAAEIEASNIRPEQSGKAKCKNYQILLPSILIALTDPIRSVRRAALEVIASIKARLSTPAKGEETEIYAYDRFYGPRASTDLQYLSTNDSNRLVTAIFDCKEEIIVDGLTAVRSLLKDLVPDPVSSSLPTGPGKNVNNSEKGKKNADNALKRKVLCFFMKVINCWQDWEGRVALLRFLTDVTDSLRMHYVGPLIQEASQGAVGLHTSKNDMSVSSTLREYTTLLLQAYLAPSKSFKGGKDSKSYEIYINALECPPDTVIQRHLASCAVERLENSLFLDLSPAHKEHVLSRVLALASSQGENSTLFSGCLRNLQIDTATYTSVLASLVSQIADKPSTSHKKAKIITGAAASNSSATSDLSTLSLFLELISIEKLVQNFDLFSVLLETLRVLLTSHSQHVGDISFPAQLVIAGMATTATKLKPDEFKADGVQLTSIVDYMRISHDPHVSHQAILLMAELARLCPEQTCQSMMPIFTFVGTHVIQRDDAFSARVVDKAIRALIPPIVDSVRSKGTSRVELIIHLRELLMMFVGARNHIPKHRRSRLFVRLIEVLGPYHFLGAVIMLLVDSNIDQSGGSLTFDLALSVWESFPSEICVAALAHFGAEIEILLGQCNTGALGVLPPKTEPDSIRVDDVQTPSEETGTTNTRRAKTLMRFIDQALSAKSIQAKLDSARATQNTDADQVLAFFMVQLLEISQPYPNLTNDEQAQEGRSIARKVAKLVALPFFARVLLPKLQNDKDRLVSCAIDLLRTRLPIIKPAHRPDIEECVKTAISTCGRRITVGNVSSPEFEPHLPLSVAIETLGDIALYSTGPEQSVLSQFYPQLVAMLTSCQDTQLTLTILRALVQSVKKLGPRLLPHIKMTITTCASLVKSVLTANDEHPHHAIVRQGFELMNTTLQNSASFIVPYLPTLINVLIDREVNQALARSPLSTVETARASLLRTMTKVVPLEELDKALISMWPSINLCRETVLVLLEVLLRAIKRAKVPVVIRDSKTIFNFLLLVFDLRCTHPKVFSGSDLAEIEANASSVFMSLVLKLNDATLKPLLLNLIDWAAMADSDNLINSGIQPASLQRCIPMYRVFATFLDQLQILGVPYYVHLLDHSSKLLTTFAAGETICDDLWFQLVRVLENAFQYDQDGFWNVTRLSKVTRPIIDQLRLAGKINDPDFLPQLKRLACKLSRKVSEHDTLLKVLSSGILEELRAANDVQIKLAGLGMLEEIWGEIGGALVGFVPEMVGGYLIEAMEDNEGGVDLAAKRVVKLIEEELGEGIDGYLA